MAGTPNLLSGLAVTERRIILQSISETRSIYFVIFDYLTKLFRFRSGKLRKRNGFSCVSCNYACMSHLYEERPEGTAEDWTISQDWGAYTPAEHAMWDRLFERQSKMLPGRAVDEFLDGLDVLRMSKPGIPDFDELSERLMKRTGWRVVAVPGLVPDSVFFEHLANRRFVAGRFIRTPEQLDYLQEPDIFHDVFGHVPLLANPVFADYMQAYGEGGLRANGLGAIDNLARLYWYTVEFGLIRQGDGLKLYGAGIVSSYGESIFALDDPSPNRLGFDLKRLMRTKYRIDDYQQTYFVIDSFEDLLKQTTDTDFAPLYHELENAPDLEVASILPEDRIFNIGAQTYAHSKEIS